MIDIKHLKFEVPVRCCFGPSYTIGPFFPTFKQAIVIHNPNGKITHDVITEGECILLPPLTGLTGESIAEIINSLYASYFNSRGSVEAFICYGGRYWDSIRVALIEF